MDILRKLMLELDVSATGMEHTLKDTIIQMGWARVEATCMKLEQIKLLPELEFFLECILMRGAT